MSAAEESTVLSGDRRSLNNTRLDEPSDAVHMNNMVEKNQTSEHNSSENPSETLGGDGASSSRAAEETSPQTQSDQAVTSKESGENHGAETKDAEEGGPSGAPPADIRERSDSINAIGAAVDEIKNGPSGADTGPVCNITLLLTTGGRHPYRIDAKYLSKRNVEIPGETEDGQPDPFSISIYTLKELILREWRSDWEPKPPSPTSLRLIHFGKLLDDKEPLSKYQLSMENPNVVHLSIRPQDLDEEDPRSGAKNLSGTGGDSQRSRGGGCCVIL